MDQFFVYMYNIIKKIENNRLIVNIHLFSKLFSPDFFKPLIIRGRSLGYWLNWVPRRIFEDVYP